MTDAIARAETKTVSNSQHPGAPAPAVELIDVSQTFRTKSGPHLAVRDIDLTVNEGEFVSVVGPSGCGKSTILYMVAGLRPPTSGEVHVLGKRVTAQTGPDLDVGFVFQKDAVLPWKTALQNVALGLRYRGASKRSAEADATEWLARVGLAGFGDRYPAQLSGGMRKRVAIAASLVLTPKVLLMDEPFSALDAQTRMIMENDLLSIWEETKQTVIFVTHDLEEAVGLSDRVITMTAGPGTILSDRASGLPRPRDLQEVRFEPAFTRLHEMLWEDLREQVQIASSRASAAGVGDGN
ncbi:ABC transporter ATP-binding protein [Microbacterium pumilum]|uniref:ABC transporter ATP-binding protein n=1 Tax=Microbacterium pumilum TaxID=344165 RepID=A0ABN2T2W2_9MICO